MNDDSTVLEVEDDMQMLTLHTPDGAQPSAELQSDGEMLDAMAVDEMLDAMDVDDADPGESKHHSVYPELIGTYMFLQLQPQ